MTRSGLRQHRDLACSFVIDGGLHDDHGPIGLRQAGINLQQAGINLSGATQDAIAYRNSARLTRRRAGGPSARAQ